ncbi:MAG: hypothetical protein JXR77_12120 [Lentisphaeria bacterium]|nr:hypothetical protein [Lentisphaeria bacterium]
MTAAQSDPSTRRITLAGIGRGGLRIAAVVQRRYAFAGLRVVGMDTDAEALRQSGVPDPLLLGQSYAHGEGCGGDEELAEQALAASTDAMRAVLDASRLVFAVAGLGGGVGNAALRVVSRLARECAVPVVFVVTLPFSFEGVKRVRAAEQALLRLRGETDAVVAIPNSLLFGQLPPDTPSADAFALAGNLLAQAVAGLARICCAEGLLTADLAGVKRMVRRPGSTCALGIGLGEGETACEQAVNAFFASPFVGGAQRLRDVDGALLTVLGGEDLTIRQVQCCLDGLQECFQPSARLLVGAYIDPRMQGRIQVTGLVVREAQREGKAQPDLLSGEPRPGETEGAGTRRPRGAAPPPGLVDELPFPEQQPGVFAGSPHPTFRNGENLDIPTFQRRNARIDPGVERVEGMYVPEGD